MQTSLLTSTNMGAEQRPSLQLAPNQMLPGHAADCRAWRVESGLLCLGPTPTPQAAAPVYGVARPGDWVCLPHAGVSAWALVPSSLSPQQAPQAQADWHALLVQICAQQCRQAAELAAMRTGPAADRVRHLLLMLAPHGEPMPDLPPLRAMSQLVDAAPETVSRVVSALRQLHLLAGKRSVGPAPATDAVPLSARALPKGLTRSEGAPRRARLLALQSATVAAAWAAQRSATAGLA
jgi:hypothetical protein